MTAMSLWNVIHMVDNGGDFRRLHSEHVVEAADEDDAKAKSLQHVLDTHQYNEVTQPRFLTSVTPAPVGAIPTVPVEEPVVEEDPDDDDVEEVPGVVSRKPGTDQPGTKVQWGNPKAGK